MNAGSGDEVRIESEMGNIKEGKGFFELEELFGILRDGLLH